MAKGLKPNFWRAVTDNERGNYLIKKYEWKKASLFKFEVDSVNTIIFEKEL